MENISATLEQNVVNEHFAEAAPYWRDIYRLQDVYSRIHQQRNALVLLLVEQLRLPAGSRILDLGCGSGLTTVALAQRGYRLDALDTVPAMLELTRQTARQAEVSDQVSASVGDAHQIPYPDESFHVVTAMGVTPFLHSLPLAMREMTRVVKPGGYVLVNADNGWRLNYVLDPRRSPGHGTVPRGFWCAHHIAGDLGLSQPSRAQHLQKTCTALHIRRKSGVRPQGLWRLLVAAS